MIGQVVRVPTFVVKGLAERAEELLKTLKTKSRLLYLKTHPYREVNTFHLGYKKQSVGLI